MKKVNIYMIRNFKTGQSGDALHLCKDHAEKVEINMEKIYAPCLMQKIGKSDFLCTTCEEEKILRKRQSPEKRKKS